MNHSAGDSLSTLVFKWKDPRLEAAAPKGRGTSDAKEKALEVGSLKPRGVHFDQQNNIKNEQSQWFQPKNIKKYGVLDHQVDAFKNERVVVFLSSFMFQAVSTLVQNWGTFQQLWFSLSCPLHCGSSHLPWIFSGFFAGVAVGFFLCLCLLRHLVSALPGVWPLHSEVRPGSHNRPRPDPSPQLGLARLRAYVNE